MADPKAAATGSFQTYVRAPINTAVRIPDSLSYTDAVVLPLAISTASTGLYLPERFALPYPSLNPTKQEGIILIWGGSSCVGCAAIQLAKASGYEVYTTASKANFGMVKEVGASKIFDRSSPTVVKDIISALGGFKLIGIFDCITSPETTGPCREIAKSFGLTKIVGVKPVQGEVEGEPKYGDMIHGTSPQTTEIGPRVYHDYLEKALEEGRFLARPGTKVVGDGLGDLQGALDQLKKGVSATRLVVTL